MTDMERRGVDLDHLELRDLNPEDDGFIGQISGYAIVFNQPSVDLGSFVEYVDEGALNGVDLSNVLALRSHNMDNVLGRSNGQTLALKVDEKGLFFELNLLDTTVGRDTYTDIKAGVLSGMSFGFTVNRDDWNFANDESMDTRHIQQIDTLYEISVVAMPAYQQTDVTATRSYTEQKELRDSQRKAQFNRLYMELDDMEEE